MSQPNRPSGLLPNASPAGSKLLCSPADRASIEARNSLRQFDEVCRLVRLGGGFKITPTLICNLQRISMQDIFSCAGELRQHPVYIHNSHHTPPEHTRIPWLVQEMCDYANASTTRPAIHTAAFLMWRLNWIHPFRDGNGRTSRAIGYYALCARLGFVPPGQPTIPELIAQDRQPYYDALDDADADHKAHNTFNVVKMETLVERLLTMQLASVIKAAKQ